MDILGQIGGITSAGSYPDINPPQPSFKLPQPAPAVASNQTSDPSVSQPLDPALASAPSPTPAAVIASAKALSPSILYAPSAPPHGVTHFDRSA